MNSHFFTPFQTLKTLREALEIIRKNITFKLPVEEIDIKDAYWRILAEDLISPINIPPFTRSAVDGYAVKFEDVSSASENSPVILDLVGESITGQPFEGHVKSGEAVYVSTGAKIPAGADTIIMVEYAKRQENKVEIYKSAPPSYNFSIEGEDVKKGEIILEKGRILTPYDIALLGNIGICKVKVRKRPIIGIILTGSELVEPCQEGQQNLKEEGKIIDNLSLILIGLINWFGFKYKHYGPAMAHVSGKLLYEFADPGEWSGKPLKNASFRLVKKYSLRYTSHYNNTGTGDQSNSGDLVLPDNVAWQYGLDDAGEVVAIVTTDAEGNFSFSFMAYDSSDVVVKRNVNYYASSTNAGEFRDQYTGDVYREYKIILDHQYLSYYLIIY